MNSIENKDFDFSTLKGYDPEKDKRLAGSLQLPFLEKKLKWEPFKEVSFSKIYYKDQKAYVMLSHAEILIDLVASNRIQKIRYYSEGAFLKQFDTLFLAAATGNLPIVQKIVKEPEFWVVFLGFRRVYAVNLGIFNRSKWPRALYEDENHKRCK